MNAILRQDVQEFIDAHLNDDIPSLALGGPYFDGVNTKIILEQIVSKKKCQKKLPTWFNATSILYPPKLHIEQTSSETTASFKSNLVKGRTLLDLAGGLGVDAFYFAQVFDQVIHYEINAELSAMAKHNFERLNCPNITCLAADGLEYLHTLDVKADVIYLDPGRRSNTEKRVFRLEDCTPNLLDHMDLLFEKGRQVLVKTAPLLDISLGMKQLRFVSSVHVVSVNNEVKELVWLLDPDKSNCPKIYAVNLSESGNWQQVVDWPLTQASPAISDIQDFLYEPLAGVLKAGIHDHLALELGLDKLNPQSHLYTSSQLISFPGQSFKIVQVAAYNKKGFESLKISQANFKVRNAPDSTDALRKKFKFKDGGDFYLFFTTDKTGKGCIIKSVKI
jgi:16S rRNA G966 N2-methylase RsmD